MAKLVSKLFRYGYGALDDLGMFSPTEKVIDLLPQDKGTPEQIFQQMKQIGGKPVKEEMLFTGIEDAFSTSPKVTKPELQEYLADNKTRVQEVVKSDKKAMEAGQLDVFKEFYPFSVQNIVRGGINRGERSVNDILDGLAQDDDYFKKLLDDISNDPARTGTIDNPFVKKIGVESLSPEFLEITKRKYRSGIDNLDDVGPNFKDKDDMFENVFDTNAKNLIQFRFIDERDNAYTIRGNKNIGFEIATSTNTDKNHFDKNFIGQTDSFNEALVQINARRRKLAETNEGGTNLKPQHENYTLPGGTNYQEIILKMDEPIDNVGSIAGKFDEIVQKDRFGAILNLNAITGSPSDVTLTNEMLDMLKKGKVLDIGIDRKIKYNKETDNIEVLKKDYTNYSHTGDEKNVVVFTRTKDRIDEDGKKILYAEEIQSDMAQQGRKSGLVMGQNEKKSFINTNNPIIYGDILDSINKLKETTNIADLKGLKQSNTEARDIQIGKIQPAKQTIGFDNDDNVIGQTIVDFNKAHSFEDIVKKKTTKYKFNELKDNRTQRLVNQGLDKSSANQINPDVLEDAGIVVPKSLYDDVSDNVDISLFTGRIKSFRKVLAEKIYNREFDKIFGTDDNPIPENRANFDVFTEFQDRMLQKFLSKDDYKQFIKNTTNFAEERMPFFAQMELADYKKLSDTDIVPIIVTDETRKLFGNVNKITKAEFKKAFIDQEVTNEKSKLINSIIDVTDVEKNNAKNFDYSDNAIDEVYDNLNELNTNLNKAVKYDVKLNPISKIPSAPFIGSSERFTELAIKRLLKYANDNDYDGVSFSTGLIHDKRWSQPNLTQYYDVVIPKVAKNILKGTDSQLEYKTIFSDEKFKKAVDEGTLSLEPELYDINKILKEGLGEPQTGGFIKDSPTIYLTPQIKNYIDSGISLYSPIVATGIAGTIANQILGSEEDIVENEGI